MLRYIKKFYSLQFLFVCFAIISLSATAVAAETTQLQYPIIGAVLPEGSTAFQQQQMLTAYIDLIGLPATNQNLDKIRNRIVALYGESGYYLPQVTIIQNANTANVFSAQIQEPVVKSFNVIGGNDNLQAQANLFLSTIVGSTVYSSTQFEELKTALKQNLQLGVSVQPKHIPGTPGDFHIEVELTGSTEFEVTMSNAGSNRLGKETMAAELWFVNTIPGLETFYLNTFNTVKTDGFRSLGSGFTVSASKRNTFLVDANLSRARLEISGQPDVVFDKQNYSLSWRFAVAEEHQGGNGFGVSVLARDFQQSQFTDDIDEKLRLVELGYWAYKFYARYGFSWAINARQGLDAMGAELIGPLADPNTDIDFSRTNVSLITYIQLAQQWSLRIDSRAQYSSDNLPFSQRFAIASNATAKAYESGELNGDSGAGVQLELQRNLDLPTGFGQWSTYIYYGVGRVKDNLTDDSISGASAGIGSRWSSDSWRGYIEVGKPLIEESIYRTSTPRAQASISYRF